MNKVKEPQMDLLLPILDNSPSYDLHTHMVMVIAKACINLVSPEKHMIKISTKLETNISRGEKFTCKTRDQYSYGSEEALVSGQGVDHIYIYMHNEVYLIV